MRTRTAIRLASIAFSWSRHRRGWLIVGCLAAIVAAAGEFPPRSIGQTVRHDEKIQGGTVTVVDGDTLKFDGVRVRIHGIDAPERKQMCIRGSVPYACGEAAASALAKLIQGHEPICNVVDQDKYRRPVAICYLGQVDIGRWRSRPLGWCRSGGVIALSGLSGRLCHAATAGSMMMGSSLSGAIVSSVM